MGYRGIDAAESRLKLLPPRDRSEDLHGLALRAPNRSVCPTRRRPTTITLMTPIRVTSVDGVSLDAVIHYADGARPRGTAVLAHGLTVDMDEGGMFIRLAERLAETGFSVLRFSYRGHGRSDGTQRGVTIAGELLDLQAIVEYATTTLPEPRAIVAASFGAVSTALSLPYLDGVERLVLWNPVLDLIRTFVAPELPWGLENFSAAQQHLLHSQGFLRIDGSFELGRVMFEEFQLYHPHAAFTGDGRPALVVHGTHDTYVSFDIARDAALRRGCDIHPIQGSDHGFDSPEREDEAIQVTVEWLAERRTS